MLMHQVTRLNPLLKEDEALRIQKRRNTHLRLHLEGDEFHVLLIMHLNVATVQAQVQIPS